MGTGLMAAVEERTRVAVDELETLWEAPVVPEPPRRRRRVTLPRPLVLVPAWLGLVVLSFFAPPPEPGVTPPVWAQWLDPATMLLLVWAASRGLAGARRAASAASLVAAGAVAVLAWECRASGHHAGQWSLIELGCATALLVLSGGCLARTVRERT